MNWLMKKAIMHLKPYVVILLVLSTFFFFTSYVAPATFKVITWITTSVFAVSHVLVNQRHGT